MDGVDRPDRRLLRRHRPDPGRHDGMADRLAHDRAARLPAAADDARRPAFHRPARQRLYPPRLHRLHRPEPVDRVRRVAGVDGGGHEVRLNSPNSLANFGESGPTITTTTRNGSTRNGSEETMSKTVRRTLLAGTVLASAIAFAALPALAQSADQLN